MQKLSFRNWKSRTRTGFSVLLDGARVGHLERRKGGWFCVRLRRAIGRANHSKVQALATRLCPGMGGVSRGFIER
jgi:hypothetical protein